MNNPKWTVACVNFNSFELIKYQAKYFHENYNDFEFLIYDHEGINELYETQELTKKYPKMKIIPSPMKTPGIHGYGLGLNACLMMAKGKYILMTEPQVFWLKKNILSFMESFIDQGYHAIGSEHWGTNFPMPWSSAYIVDEIRDLDMRSKSYVCEKCQTAMHDRDYDTGFQLRVRLKNKPHYFFRETKSHNMPSFGGLSLLFWQTFSHDGKQIAHHLCGSHKYENLHDMKEKHKELTEWAWQKLYD